MNNPGHISESFENFDADPGWKKFGSGINIPDPQHCSQDGGRADLSKKPPRLTL
jgi:hypothetical protein